MTHAETIARRVTSELIETPLHPALNLEKADSLIRILARDYNELNGKEITILETRTNCVLLEGGVMIALKLVRLIEKNADVLANHLIKMVNEHPRTQVFCKNIPRQELHDRAYEIYRHLSECLMEKTDEEIRKKNIAIGERRAEQGVPLHEVIFALMLVRENLWKEVKASGVGDNAIELFQALELIDRVYQFFDKAIYYMALGYENAYLSGKAELRGRSEKELKEFNELRHLVLPWWP